MPSKNLMSTCHGRFSQRARGSRRARRSTRKSRIVFVSANDCQHAVQEHSDQAGPALDEPFACVEDAVSANNDLELVDLISCNSTEKVKLEEASSESNPSSQKSPGIAADEPERKVILFEGNKAILVDAIPWPTRTTRESVTEAYKQPNPRLTEKELRRQARLVEERRAIDDENKRERRRRKYLRGIYCLPQKLIAESRARLIHWYKAPSEPQDCQK